MKTIKNLLTYKTRCLDGRDTLRLADFVPNKDLATMGYVAKEGREPTELTRENVLKQLAKDLAFGWEKANDARGISSALMAYVVTMWDWVLSDEDYQLVDPDQDYLDYNRDTFKWVAKKYGIKLEDN